jgi:hypothetical protein
LRLSAVFDVFLKDIENENFLETPVFFNGKIYGFMATPVDPGRTLSYLDPASGSRFST